MSLPVGVDTPKTDDLDLRNRVAGRVANAVLRIATPTYRDFIRGAIEYGMDAAARDNAEGREAPRDWRDYRRRA